MTESNLCLNCTKARPCPVQEAAGGAPLISCSLRIEEKALNYGTLFRISQEAIQSVVDMVESLKEEKTELLEALHRKQRNLTDVADELMQAVSLNKKQSEEITELRDALSKAKSKRNEWRCAAQALAEQNNELMDANESLANKLVVIKLGWPTDNASHNKLEKEIASLRQLAQLNKEAEIVALENAEEYKLKSSKLHGAYYRLKGYTAAGWVSAIAILLYHLFA